MGLMVRTCKENDIRRLGVNNSVIWLVEGTTTYQSTDLSYFNQQDILVGPFAATTELALI